MLSILLIVFIVLLIAVGALFLLQKPAAERPKPSTAPPPEPEAEEEVKEKLVAPIKAPVAAPSPAAQVPAVPAKPIKTELLGKIGGFASDIMDLSLIYDIEHKLILSAAEVQTSGRNRAD